MTGLRLYVLDGGRVTVSAAEWPEFADDGAYDGRTSDRSRRLGDARPSIPEQLVAADTTERDIRFLALSHGHWDHSGNAGLFAASTWIVHPAERAAMFH